MKVIKLFIIVLSAAYLSSCTSFRTAEGLNGGEANVTFIAPATGAIRVGLSDNIETRVMMTGAIFSSDIYLHTKNDSGKVNFGFTAGAYFFDGSTGYYTGPTIGIRLRNYYPYLTIIKSIDLAQNVKIAFGSEIRISHNRIVLTPEIIYEIPPLNLGDGLNAALYASLGIGYTFNLVKMFE